METGLLRVMVLLALLASEVLAETHSEALKRRQLQYPDLTEIVFLAASAPPEFSAQAMLRVAAAPALTDKEWKRELLDQAFSAANGASVAIGKRTGLGLDRLSLQANAVKAMLPLDARHARELFLSISQPRPDAPRCGDKLTDDPSVYFLTAAKVAEGAFTPEERRRDDVALFLNDRVRGISSALEIEPAVQMVNANLPSLTAGQSELLMSSIAAAREAFQPAPHCADAPPATSKVSNRIGERIKALFFGKEMQALTDTQKNTPEWRDEFEGLLREINGVKQDSGESESTFFHRKGDPLYALLAAAPPGTMRDIVLQNYIAFLKGSNLQQENLVAWFEQVNDLAGVTRSMNAAEYKKMLDAFERSGNAVLSLYGRLEKVLPSVPAWAQSGL